MNLIFPYGRECVKSFNSESFSHLALEEIIGYIASSDDDKKILSKVFSSVVTDEKTIGYRQAILKDYIDNRSFCDKMREILSRLDVLNEFNLHNHFRKESKASIWDVLDFMEEIEVYIEIIESMKALFEENEVNSEGLKEIASLIDNVLNEEKIDDMKELVNSFKADVSTLKSVTLGVNLSPDLTPDEVIFLEFNKFPFRSKLDHIDLGASIGSMTKVVYREHSQLMKYLCTELEKELSKTVKKNKRQLMEYINLKGYFLLDICNDLKYYLLIADFARRIKEDGYNLCFPAIDNNKDFVSMKGIYNIRLACKKEKVVKNDFSFVPNENIFILTGPNRGGKTILTQAVGINVLFASLGLFVMADSYEGFAFEGILTHFPADENQTLDMGRLGEEAVRIKKIVSEATPLTLVLLNETYSSTSASDALYLASDLVRILKHKNIPTIFNTHIHDLARSTDKMNGWDGKSNVVSLTMEIIDNVNTFKVVKKEPDSCSFAKNIALKYGVTYEQMLES